LFAFLHQQTAASIQHNYQSLFFSQMASTPKQSWADVTEKDEELAKEVENLNIPKEKAKDEDAPLASIEKKVVCSTGLQRGGKVILEQQDPTSPLYSVRSFEELNLAKELLNGIYAMGFNRPSKIQEAALPIILAKEPKNLIAQAQSGTGKTAAFVLCMLSRVDVNVNAPQALCVCPTRELARQIVDNVNKMGQFSKAKTQLVVKDTEVPKRIESQIVVGTPGRILDLIKNNVLALQKLKVFVLDEADIMIDREGLGEQSVKIRKMLPRTCQILLFSATFKPTVREFASRIVPQPCYDIRLKRKQLTLDGIKQLHIDCGSEEKKFDVLSDIYGYLTVGQSIIFVHTRKTAIDLTAKMLKAGHTVSLLHGGEDMSPSQRDKVIDDFRDAKTKVLITTNVLARGIDILQVMMVINYDLPLDVHNRPDTETYLHRIGRSGRFGRKGIAINFVHDDVSRKNLKYLEEFFQRQIPSLPIDQIPEIQNLLNAMTQEAQELQEKINKGELPEDDDDDEQPPKNSNS